MVSKVSVGEDGASSDRRNPALPLPPLDPTATLSIRTVFNEEIQKSATLGSSRDPRRQMPLAAKVCRKTVSILSPGRLPILRSRPVGCPFSDPAAGDFGGRPAPGVIPCCICPGFPAAGSQKNPLPATSYPTVSSTVIPLDPWMLRKWLSDRQIDAPRTYIPREELPMR